MRQILQTLILAAAGITLFTYISGVSLGRPDLVLASVGVLALVAGAWYKSFDIEET